MYPCQSLPILMDSERTHAKATGDLTLLLTSIQVGCKFVSCHVMRSGLAHTTGLAGESNVQGEAQQKLDVISNEIFINSLKSSGTVAVMITEELEHPIIVEKELRGKYGVVFDPLDGSSNIDVGVNVGTIFGIYAIDEHAENEQGKQHFFVLVDLVKSILRPGREMVAAGYAMYGSSTCLVLTTGHGTNGYTLDPMLGEFILTHPKIQIPKRGNIYSVNEGNSTKWTKETAEYFAFVKGELGPNQQLESSVIQPHNLPYSSRYIGSMVADVHRTLLYGGIFAYPADTKSKQGKLRMLYEALPMAMIVEQAGGKASNGSHRMLDLVPESIHARTPVVLGSNLDVEDYEEFARKGK